MIDLLFEPTEEMCLKLIESFAKDAEAAPGLCPTPQERMERTKRALQAALGVAGFAEGYEAVVTDVAADLRVEREELDSRFRQWINEAWPHEASPPEWNAACYAVYRLTKQSAAFRMVTRSRESWRERAISLGSPPHLVNPQERSPDGHL